MIPGLIVFLAALPLTPNGKVNRRALPAPDYQNSSTTTTYVAPELTIHYQLIQIWEELLSVRPIGIHDNFFALGGHSLLAARLMARIAEVCGKTLPLSTLFKSATIEELANVLRKEPIERQTRTVVTPIQASGGLRPFFFLHGDWNGKAFYCLKLSRELGKERPFYLLEPYTYDGLYTLPSIEQVAAAHITVMREIQPEGPYLLGGWCNGAMVAYEMARQLQAQQQEVELLILMDAGTSSPFSTLLRRLLWSGNLLLRLKQEQQDTLFFRILHLYEYVRLWNYRQRLVKQARIERPPEEVEIAHPNFASPFPPAEHLRDNYMAIFNWLASGYIVRPYGGKIATFWAEEDNPGRRKVWERLLAREKHVKTYFVPGTHMSSRTKYIDALARALRESIEEDF
jgi:thioesterase domain-containing protein